MRAQFVFLHYHIFKNAGSTIDWILAKNFPNSFERLEPQQEKEFVTNEDVLEFLEQHPQLSALSSHTFRLPSPKHPVFKFIEICFVRHPLDRLQSMYYYYRKIDGAYENIVKAKLLSLPDFLAWMVAAQPFNTMSSQTCLFSTGGDYYFPPSEAQLLAAISCLQEIKFVGVVDRMDESLIVAEFFLRPIFPHLDLSYLAQNVSCDRKVGLNQRLDEMRSLCGDKFWINLGKLNESDTKLWEFANKELDRRLAFVPNLEQKMLDFRERCERIRTHTQTNSGVAN